MAPATLRFIVRTPHEAIFDGEARSIRVLSETGQVGIRPRTEPLVLPVEAGLVLVHTDDRVIFIGSAGGLLSARDRQATLFTPFAVTGTDPAAIRNALDHALATPDSEFAVRAKLGKLEGRILAELHAPAGERPLLGGERR
jgi:F0F1-type ATP synthase epsilon subunit